MRLIGTMTDAFEYLTKSDLLPTASLASSEYPSKRLLHMEPRRLPTAISTYFPLISQQLT